MTTRSNEVLRLFGAKPLLIEAAKLDAVYATRRPYALQNGVAIIDIAGVLANEPSLFDAIVYGATAYGQILDEVEQAIADPEVRGVLLRVNSPGGDSDSAFETADTLERLGKQKPLWAVADNSMFSAAYLLGSSAARIYVPAYTGGVGSVGVYAQHVDWSEYNRKLGVKVTYIAEGEGKTDGNPDEPLSDAARATLEAEVARLYGLLVSAVSARRDLTEDAVRELGAALKYGPDAVTAGLADRTGTFRDALSDLIAAARKSGVSVGPTISKPGGNQAMTEETARVENPEPPPIDVDRIRADARQQGYAEAREIVELCALARMPSRAISLLVRNASVGEVRQQLLEAMVAEDAPEIHSHVMPETGTRTEASAESSPVVKAVERMAAATKGGK
ncbi:MAG: S49 family peptidase [Bryobacterales bacterium]|nr:S49 family peptidase [Bryobacterales bacterium]